ncbi:hypothetical protein EYR40_008429 [Pleurotus pulmonarius]|nr:hypothetical protein EYR40_008429 [Pleurotus pulmonarius]
MLTQYQILGTYLIGESLDVGASRGRAPFSGSHLSELMLPPFARRGGDELAPKAVAKQRTAADVASRADGFTPENDKDIAALRLERRRLWRVDGEEANDPSPPELGEGDIEWVTMLSRV